MRNEVEMALKGEQIPLEAFARATDLLHGILAAIDGEMSGGEGRLRWTVVDLRMASAGLVTAPEAETETVGDYRGALIASFANGIQLLEKEPERPPHFPDSALFKAKDLAALINGRVSEVRFRAWSNGSLATIGVTQHLSANVDRLLGGSLTSWGSVEGVAETLTIHSGTYFTLYSPLGGPAIRCNCDRETLDSVKVGDRLLVAGRLTSTRQGIVKAVRVDSIRRLRSRDALPQPDAMIGRTRDHGFPSGDEVRAWARSGHDA